MIPLKIKAFFDLSQRKLQGESIDSHTVSKHKNDVFRLLTISETIPKITLPCDMKNDIDQFITVMHEERPALKDIGITTLSLDDLLENLAIMYQ